MRTSDCVLAKENHMKQLAALAFALGVGGGLTQLSASLILLSPTEMSGTGLGAVNTVLTLQSAANATIETGCVGVVNGATSSASCGFTDANVQTQSGTPTLQSVGVTDASNLRIVFNAAEPGNALDIMLNSLVLTFYNSTGTAAMSFSLFPGSGILFPSTQSGVGNSGFVFALTTPTLCAFGGVTCPGDINEAATAQTFINANGGVGSVRVGLGASAGVAAGGPGSATGGMETFFVEGVGTVGGPGGGGGGSPIPEPASMALIGAGLVTLAISQRRRIRA